MSPHPTPDTLHEFAHRDEFARWLAAHHDMAPELWIRIYKKGSGRATISPTEAIDEVLCWGWIDAIRKSWDDVSYVQRYCPRRPRSVWSRVNRDNVARLIAEGRMTEHGLVHVRAAQADGRWEAAYATTMEASLALLDAIATSPTAQAMYDTLSAQIGTIPLTRRGPMTRRSMRSAHRASRVMCLLALSVFSLACGGDDVTVPVAPRDMSEASSAFDMMEAPAAAAFGKVAGDANGFDVLAQVRGTAAATDSTTNPSLIIRNGTVALEVRSIEPAMVAVQNLAARLGGTVGNSSMSSAEYQRRSARIELKIPAARFDSALVGLEPIGTVESVSSSAEDVGEEFVDVTARVANARRLEERLISLLATRAGKLEEVLAVERELARVREEIERYTGRIRYLQSRVATSTLTVTLREPAPLVRTSPGDNVIMNAFRDAWRNFVGFVAGFIALLGVIVPSMLLLVIVVWGWRRARRPRAG